MKQAGMFVEKMNEAPEVRSVVPGHLVRCGHSSAYDVCFGKEAGAAAVMLLANGTTGVTIVGIDGDKVRYMESKKAIEQRHVDLDQVAVYEAMGTCFGRTPEAYKPKFEKAEGKITRHL
jgi:6-phosphofructokinase 1